jgi:hypothetical protein
MDSKKIAESYFCDIGLSATSATDKVKILIIKTVITSTAIRGLGIFPIFQEPLMHDE